MSSLTIYAFGTIQVRAIIKPDDSSQQQVTLMQEDILALTFESPVKIDFQKGDYTHFLGKLYQINQLPGREEKSTRRIAYTLNMEAEMYDLAKASYLFLDQNGNFTEPVFPLRSTLRGFADLIIYNLKRIFPTADWKLGEVEETDFKTIEFDSQNCFQVLQTLASEFETEYLVVGKTINLKQIQSTSNIVLKRGQNQPLLSLKESPQDASNVITRLWAFGSTKNITASYRDGAQRLRMGDLSYLEKNVELYRVNEYIKIFDGTNGTQEIYPHRTGTISDVDAFDPDSAVFSLTDSDIDFNVNTYLIPGGDIKAQIVFNTGQLSGYTFDVSSFDNSTKKFTINVNTNDPNFIVPNTNFQPQVGDQYVVVNISQPQSYIDAAEAELAAAAQDFLDKNSIPPVVYTGEINQKWFKDNNRFFNLGDQIQVESEILGIHLITRITNFTRKVNDIFDITMTLSDNVAPKSIIVKLINGL